jgi:hypothetical protein
MTFASEPVVTSRRTTITVTHTMPKHAEALGPVTLRLDGGMFCVQDYLTVDECMAVAAQLTAAALMTDPKHHLRPVS